MSVEAHAWAPRRARQAHRITRSSDPELVEQNAQLDASMIVARPRRDEVDTRCVDEGHERRQVDDPPVDLLPEVTRGGRIARFELVGLVRAPVDPLVAEPFRIEVDGRRGLVSGTGEQVEKE